MGPQLQGTSSPTCLAQGPSADGLTTPYLPPQALSGLTPRLGTQPAAVPLCTHLCLRRLCTQTRPPSSTAYQRATLGKLSASLPQLSPCEVGDILLLPQ